MTVNKNNALLQISAGNLKQFPRERIPQIAMSGRSNVGKSSMINALLERKKLARVSSEPGKTITVNFYNIDKKLFLVDLPGYGYAKRPIADKQKWSTLTDGYFTKNENVDLLKCVIQLIDLKVGPTADDEMMLDFMNNSGIPYIVVATKVDKLNKTQREACLEKLTSHPLIAEDVKIIPFSSVSGEGKKQLWDAIFEYCQ